MGTQALSARAAPSRHKWYCQSLVRMSETLPSASPAAGGKSAATSVICTVRDEERHVEAALRSALATDAIEVVVVDDGSTDGTGQILRRLAQEDDRLRVLTTGGSGRGAALAAAFGASTAPFVMNLDADDLVHPAWVGRGAALMAAHPELGALTTSPRYLDAGEHITWPPAPVTLEPRDVTDRLALSNPLVHSATILRRSAVVAIGGYDAFRRTHFDYDLWTRLAAAGWRLGRVDARLVCKRLHAGQKFERDGRLAYLWSTARIQLRAIRIVGAGRWTWGVLAARLVWGLLPRALRMAVRRRFARNTGESLAHTAGADLERMHSVVRRS